MFKVEYFGPHRHTELILNDKINCVNVAATINAISLDPYRMSTIVACVKEELKDPVRNIFIFADRREYLERIRIMLTDNDVKENDIKIVENIKEYENIINIDESYANNDEIITDNDDIDVSAKRLVGGVKEEDIYLAELNAKVILTTYAFMGTGKSIPKMISLILAHPRKTKSEQFIKRIFRLGGDNSIVRNIYDIVDMNTTLKNQWNYRKKYYKTLDADMEIHEYRYDKEEKIDE